jgi:hypothetical protein
MVREFKVEEAGAQPPDGDVDLSVVQLDVYDGRDGWWNPEHDMVVLPEGWEFLPTGQAFVTRTVKADGVFWVAWAPRSRTRRHRQLLGLWAPGATIANAHHVAEATRVTRESRRAAGARSRDRQEIRYQGELAESIVTYLAFSADHHALALSIAASASERAAVVGSGRVGRTRVLTLEARAALAARAEIRHAHTDYHQQLAELNPFEEEDDRYRAIKAEAHDAVDAFLDDHRQQLP